MTTAVQTKVCKTCGQEKPLEEFNRHPNTRDKRNIYCKPCHRERSKNWQRGPGKAKHRAAIDRYRATDKGRASGRRVSARSYAKHPERHNARRAVHDALKAGTLQRPDICRGCGEPGPVQGHHWSYGREHWLDVTWLCSRCHNSIHHAMESEAVA